MTSLTKNVLLNCRYLKKYLLNLFSFFSTFPRIVLVVYSDLVDFNWISWFDKLTKVKSGGRGGELETFFKHFF